MLWFNFLAGFAYVAAGIGLGLGRRGAAWLAVFSAFGIHIVTGGAYELRTVVAMTVRSLFWVVTALLGLAGTVR